MVFFLSSTFFVASVASRCSVKKLFFSDSVARICLLKSVSSGKAKLETDFFRPFSSRVPRALCWSAEPSRRQNGQGQQKREKSAEPAHGLASSARR